MKHHRMSILITDDHVVVRSGIRSYLEKISDFQVVGEASSGEETLSLVSELIPDIVLLDLILPGMDGIETTRRVRAYEQAVGQERTPIIAVTAYAMVGDRERCIDAGMDDYITKPGFLSHIVSNHSASELSYSSHCHAEARSISKHNHKPN